jgi:hypothetical protein
MPRKRKGDVTSRPIHASKKIKRESGPFEIKMNELKRSSEALSQIQDNEIEKILFYINRAMLALYETLEQFPDEIKREPGEYQKLVDVTNERLIKCGKNKVINFMQTHTINRLKVYLKYHKKKLKPDSTSDRSGGSSSSEKDDPGGP